MRKGSSGRVAAALLIAGLSSTGALEAPGQQWCPSGMALVPAETGSYCVDLHEASVADGVAVSAPGQLPRAQISQVEAAAACAAAGKRLCQDSEWLRACRGPLGWTYPYGNTLEPGRCNDGGTLAQTGSRSGCVTAEGIFDMVGNLGEWTADPDGTFRGGYFADIQMNGPGCLYATTAQNVSYSGTNAGFRCCAEAQDGSPPGASSFFTLSPCRVVNTRRTDFPAGLGAPSLGPAGTADRVLPLASGSCGIPATATAVSLNATAADTQGAGYLTLFPGDGAAPATSTINFAAGQVKANNLILPLATDGSGTVKVRSGATAPLNLLVDVNGYFAAGGTPSCESPIVPGSSVLGSLGPGCAGTHTPGTLARYYTFTLAAESVVTVEMTSDDFDPWAALLEGTGSAGTLVAEADDGVLATTGSWMLRTLGPGAYTIEAGQHASVSGGFTLSLAATNPAESGCQSPISIGQSLNGSWGPGCYSTHRVGRYARYYVLCVPDPMPVVITLESGVIDTYLLLLQGVGNLGGILFENDDGGGGTNSQITATLFQGCYTVEATQYQEALGSFTLSVSMVP